MFIMLLRKREGSRGKFLCYGSQLMGDITETDILNNLRYDNSPKKAHLQIPNQWVKG